MPYLDTVQVFGNDSGDAALTGQDAIGDAAHQAQASAAIDQADIVRGQDGAQPLRRVEEGRSRAVG